MASSLLPSHQRNMHGIFDTQKYIHKCDLCEWKFETTKGLEGHRRKVYEKQMLQCQKCEFKAPKRSGILYHKKSAPFLNDI